MKLSLSLGGRLLHLALPLILATAGLLISCSDDGAGGDGDGTSGDGDGTSGDGDGHIVGDGDGDAGDNDGPSVEVENPLTDPTDGPAAGNPDGGCDIPAEAGLEDISSPTTVVGDGSPASCTSAAVVDAVAKGGVITFNCGDEPVTITLEQTAKVFNDASEEVVIDGGGLVTLSGGGARQILYMNTCDEAQHFTTPHCDNQDHPRLTVQNLTFVDGKAEGTADADGGGAIWTYGGRFKAVNTRFFNNACAEFGKDLGGGAIRAFAQYEGLPIYLVNSTFGGAPGLGNQGANGGGISSIGVSWTIINSLFSYNQATGEGANGGRGGSGGAIYNDGKEMTLSLCGTVIEKNQVNAHGAGIFFVSNNRTGNIKLTDSTVRNNCGGSWYELPGISMHPETSVEQSGSTMLSECE